LPAVLAVVVVRPVVVAGGTQQEGSSRRLVGLASLVVEVRLGVRRGGGWVWEGCGRRLGRRRGWTVRDV